MVWICLLFVVSIPVQRQAFAKGRQSLMGSPKRGRGWWVPCRRAAVAVNVVGLCFAFRVREGVERVAVCCILLAYIVVSIESIYF